MNVKASPQNFTVLAKLGEGSFGKVYKVRRLEDKEVYAMKKIRIQNMSKPDLENALNQVRILASFSHPNLISFKECFYESSSGQLCIVMEIAARGDLLRIVQTHGKSKTFVPEEEIWKATSHLAAGLKSLHNRNVLHRDLKCANVFITEDGIYKIGDLNVSKVLASQFTRTTTGTPYYTSPQIWKNVPYDSKCDIWSLGCLLYEMAAKRPPFLANDIKSLRNKICSGSFERIPPCYSEELAGLISSMLSLTPNKRPNCQAILNNATLLKKCPNSQVNSAVVPMLQTLSARQGRLHQLNQILPKPQYKLKRCSSVSNVHEAALKPIERERLLVNNAEDVHLKLRNAEMEERNKLLRQHRQEVQGDVQRARVLSSQGRAYCPSPSRDSPRPGSASKKEYPLPQVEAPGGIPRPPKRLPMPVPFGALYKGGSPNQPN